MNNNNPSAEMYWDFNFKQMTDKQLKIANTKSRRIEEYENYAHKCCNSVCTSIIFSHSDNLHGTTVCTDSDIIKLVKELIISETNKKLQVLKEEFANL